ncbi:hypothetical protein [Petroclostridium sp. X23]|nr:hypothetical protein [Petroclostridium sp. X23]WHH58008.1 hypothetical protein QKW49_19680 [Petroclostridium sp. X23]
MTKKDFTAKYGQVLLPLLTPYDDQEEVNYTAYNVLSDTIKSFDKLE